MIIIVIHFKSYSFIKQTLYIIHLQLHNHHHLQNHQNHPLLQGIIHDLSHTSPLPSHSFHSSLIHQSSFITHLPSLSCTCVKTFFFCFLFFLCSGSFFFTTNITSGKSSSYLSFIHSLYIHHSCLIAHSSKKSIVNHNQEQYHLVLMLNQDEIVLIYNLQ